MITVHKKLTITNANKGRKKLNPKREPSLRDTSEPPNLKVPRISRLMALAIKYQGMLDRGQVSSVTELAKLCHVTQPRMSQILNLNLLCPKIQERLLFLPPTEIGKAKIHEKAFRKNCTCIDWNWQERQIEVDIA